MLSFFCNNHLYFVLLYFNPVINTMSSKTNCLTRAGCRLLHPKTISSHLKSESAYAGIFNLLRLQLVLAGIRSKLKAVFYRLKILFHRNNSSWFVCYCFVFMCRNFRVWRNWNCILIWNWELVRKSDCVFLTCWVFKARKSHLAFASISVCTFEFKRLLDWSLRRNRVHRIKGKKTSCALCFLEEFRFVVWLDLLLESDTFCLFRSYLG